MKSLQWFLLVAVLMVVVFGITFFKMYVQTTPKTQARSTTTGKSGTGTDGGTSQLDFVSTRYPPETRTDLLPPQTELGRGGYHDFWFENPRDKEVRLGLIGKNCVCSRVEVHLLQGPWQQPVMAAWLGSLLGMEPASPLPVATMAVVADKRLSEIVTERTRDQTHTLAVGNDDANVVVPPYTVGRVRLIWDGRGSGAPFEAKTLSAGVWFGSPQSGVLASLQVLNAWLCEPYLYDNKEATLLPMTPDELRRRAVFRFWSATRRSLDFVCDTDNDPFVSCSIRPMTADDEKRVRSVAAQTPQVRCGYQLVVEVRPRSADGKMLDLGPFVRRVRVKVLDGGAELGNEIIQVQGEVKGDVRLIPPGNQTTGVLAFGSFRSRDGKTLNATIEAERPNVVVRVEKFPDFVAEPVLERQSGSDRPTWRLQVRVLPGRTTGPLPRGDNGEIVLEVRSPGEALRRLRVPITGEATQ